MNVDNIELHLETTKKDEESDRKGGTDDHVHKFSIVKLPILFFRYYDNHQHNFWATLFCQCIAEVLQFTHAWHV